MEILEYLELEKLSNEETKKDVEIINKYFEEIYGEDAPKMRQKFIENLVSKHEENKDVKIDNIQIMLSTNCNDLKL